MVTNLDLKERLMTITEKWARGEDISMQEKADYYKAKFQYSYNNGIFLQRGKRATTSFRKYLTSYAEYQEVRKEFPKTIRPREVRGHSYRRAVSLR